MKNLQKSFAAILVGILLFSVGDLNVQASENMEDISTNIDNLSRETYDKLVEEGILGSDVPYEYWVEMNRNSLELERSFRAEIPDPNATSAASIAYKAGDIFTTTSTFSSGIFGHVGIAIDSTRILHTSGWKSEPYPTIISIAEWHKRYPETKVTRSNQAGLGLKASSNAIAYFYGKNIPYSITTGPTDLTNTYCSELVWYSYYKAGLEYNENNTRPLIVQPYTFVNIKTAAALNFTFIDNVW